jgi:hypothetical protein
MGNSKHSNQHKPGKHSNQSKPNVNTSTKPTASRVSIEKTLGQTAAKHETPDLPVADKKPYGDGALGGISNSPITKETPETPIDANNGLSFFPMRKEHEGDLVGRFVQLDEKHADNHYVVYSSGDGLWHLAHGLGKRDCYVIIDEKIANVSGKVELSIAKIFTKKFTYLTDGNALFQLVNEDGLYSLRVCGYAKSVTGWHTISESIAFLYQLPHNPHNETESGKATVNVVAQSDEALGANVALNLFKTLNLKSNVEVTDVSEIVEYSDDFAAEGFLVKFF